MIDMDLFSKRADGTGNSYHATIDKEATIADTNILIAGVEQEYHKLSGDLAKANDIVLKVTDTITNLQRTLTEAQSEYTEGLNASGLSAILSIGNDGKTNINQLKNQIELMQEALDNSTEVSTIQSGINELVEKYNQLIVQREYLIKVGQITEYEIAQKSFLKLQDTVLESTIQGVLVWALHDMERALEHKSKFVTQYGKVVK